MAGNTMASTEKTEILEEESKLIAQQYENILEEHLREEKLLRTKRYKVETQLANWLGKYDTEVGDLHKELEILQEGFDEEKGWMDELEEKFMVQEEEYIVLMEEKAIEDERLFNLKLDEFMQLRSAKVIQRWWRKILERKMRKARRGGVKKGKKGRAPQGSPGLNTIMAAEAKRIISAMQRKS